LWALRQFKEKKDLIFQFPSLSGIAATPSMSIPAVLQQNVDHFRKSEQSSHS